MNMNMDVNTNINGYKFEDYINDITTVFIDREYLYMPFYVKWHSRHFSKKEFMNNITKYFYDDKCVSIEEEYILFFLSKKKDGNDVILNKTAVEYNYTIFKKYGFSNITNIYKTHYNDKIDTNNISRVFSLYLNELKKKDLKIVKNEIYECFTLFLLINDHIHVDEMINENIIEINLDMLEKYLSMTRLKSETINKILYSFLINKIIPTKNVFNLIINRLGSELYTNSWDKNRKKPKETKIDDNDIFKLLIYFGYKMDIDDLRVICSNYYYIHDYEKFDFTDEQITLIFNEKFIHPFPINKINPNFSCFKKILALAKNRNLESIKKYMKNFKFVIDLECVKILLRYYSRTVVYSSNDNKLLKFMIDDCDVKIDLECVRISIENDNPKDVILYLLDKYKNQIV
jgi:hypothetical protein